MALLPKHPLLIGNEPGTGSGGEHVHLYPATGRETKPVRLASPPMSTRRWRRRGRRLWRDVR